MRPHQRVPLALGAAALTLATVLLGFARPAAADPPRPTDYRSVVTGVTPATDAVDVEIIGGDAFIELTVEPGHEVMVAGYDDEPYLRFEADGTVSENRNSPAAYVNAKRYGDVAVPEGVDRDAEPEWRRVADGGAYAWHDHRVHWMSPEPPPGVPRGGVVQEWDVPMLVDGRPVTVDGVLRYEAPEAWWPWALVASVAAGAVWLAGRRWPRRRVLTVAAGLGGAVAVVVAAAEQLAIPEGTGRSAVRFAVPVVALVGAAIALATARRQPRVAEVAGIAAVAALTGWAARRLGVLTKPVLPTLLAFDLDRAGTALALGAATGTVALVLTGLDRDPTPAAPTRNQGPDAAPDAPATHDPPSPVDPTTHEPGAPGRRTRRP